MIVNVAFAFHQELGIFWDFKGRKRPSAYLQPGVPACTQVHLVTLLLRMQRRLKRKKKGTEENILFFFIIIILKILFILFMRDILEREKQAPCREPSAGLDPRIRP